MSLAPKFAAAAAAVLAFTVVVTSSSDARAHCQVPCGIFDDHARVHAMLEDVATIDKAVRLINELAPKTDAQSINQRVRWINTKESHAAHIMKVIADYFLAQKIKPPAKKDKKAWAKYLQMLADHHAVMRAAMKTKQSVKADDVKALRAAVVKLETYWKPAKKKK